MSGGENDGLVADLINFQAGGGLDEVEAGSAGKERAAKEEEEKKKAMNTGLFAGIFGDKNMNKAPKKDWDKDEEFEDEEEDEEDKRRRREDRKRRRALLGKKKGPKLKMKIKTKTTSSTTKLKSPTVKLTPAPPPPPPPESSVQESTPRPQQKSKSVEESPEQLRIRDMQNVIEKQKRSIVLLKKRLSEKKPRPKSKRDWLLQIKSKLNQVKHSAASPTKKREAQEELKRLFDMKDEFSSSPHHHHHRHHHHHHRHEEKDGNSIVSDWSHSDGRIETREELSPHTQSSSKRSNKRRRRTKSVRHYAKVVMKFALRSHQNILDHALNDISSAFASFDAQGDGMLKPAEFAAALEQLDYGLTVHLIRDMTRVLVKHCALESNKINYMDFLHDMERLGSSEGAKMSSRKFHRGIINELEPDFHPKLRDVNIPPSAATTVKSPLSLDTKLLLSASNDTSETNDDWPGQLSGVPEPSPTKNMTLLFKTDEAKQNEWERKAKAFLSEELVESLRNTKDQTDAANVILNDLPDVESLQLEKKNVSKTTESGTQSGSSQKDADLTTRYTYAVAIESYDTEDESGHLKIQIGDVVQVLDETPSAVDDGMWFGRVPGETTPGLFPAKCVQKRTVSDRDRDPVWQFLRRHWLEGYYEGLTKYLGVATLNDMACFVTEDQLFHLKMRPIERRKLMWAIEKLRPGGRRRRRQQSSSVPKTSSDFFMEGGDQDDEVGEQQEENGNDWENQLEMIREGEDKTSPLRGGVSNMIMTTTASEFDTGVGVNLSDALTASAALSQYELQVGEFVCLRNAKHKRGQAANRFNPRYWTVRVLAIGASGLVRVQWFVEIRIGSRLFRPTEKVFVINTTHVDVKMLKKMSFEFKTRLWYASFSQDSVVFQSTTLKYKIKTYTGTVRTFF